MGLRTAIAGVVGGTVSQATGGKFANGAVSGAFVHLFNDEFENLFYQNKVRASLPEDHFINRIQNDIAKGFKGLYKGMSKILTMDTSDKPMAEILILKAKVSGSHYGFARSPTKLLQYSNPINTHKAVDSINGDKE